MRHSSTLYVGLDVHKESIAVAYVAKEHEAEVIYLVVFQEYVRAVNDHTDRLQRLEQELHEHV